MPTLASPLRVFIIEKQQLFGTAIAHVLSSDPNISVIGVAADPQSAQIGDVRPDVVFLDIDSDDVDGALEALQSRCPQTRICLLSMYAQPEVMQRWLSAGADGYIVKDSSLQELIAAIKAIGEGSSYVDPRVAAALLRRRTTSHVPYTSQLSPRETDIIRLIAQGLSNRDIGRRLVLSEKTVKNHVSRIFSKLHFTARSQAAVHAIRSGLA
ncbi:MAG TPA: response regulator transcription factor [Candidatus Baltobacteraceae bacterium]|nr:response regulator transcription factor [Candidatus Baltobacteraceae bacterium]